MLSEINAGPATRAIFRHRIQYGRRLAMKPLLKRIQHTPLLWMLIFVPVVLGAEAVTPHSYTCNIGRSLMPSRSLPARRASRCGS
jgi:hypothetical protein